MPGPMYYTTYTAKPLPEATTRNDVATLFEQLTHSNLPGFVVRSAAQRHAESLTQLGTVADAAHLKLRMTVFRGAQEPPFMPGPGNKTVQLFDQVRSAGTTTSLRGLYVRSGALALELFQPGPELEADRALGLPGHIPDREMYALGKHIINPDWLRSDGIRHATLFPNDIAVYRPDTHIPAVTTLLQTQPLMLGPGLDLKQGSMQAA